MANTPNRPDETAGVPSSSASVPWWSRRQVWIGSVVVLLTLAGVLGWWFYWAQFVWTDDARIDGDMPLISSKIQGRISSLLVEEGDRIKPRQTVATIHDTEIRETVAQTRYALEVQQEQIRLAQAELDKSQARLEDLLAGARGEELLQAEARLRETEASLKKARDDWERMESLYKEGLTSTAERDGAYLSYRVAEEQMRGVKNQLDLLRAGERPLTVKGARAEVERSRAALEVARSQFREMEAALRRELENLRETVIRAEREGIIAKKTAQAGEVVQPGQPIYRLTETGRYWVSANIEETEIGKVRVGQKADLKVDAYSGVAFEGKVTYIGSAAMSVFSLFPAQNAPGTFVKVTQRIPVKISIDPPGDVDRYPMRPGMSVEVKIRVKG